MHGIADLDFLCGFSKLILASKGDRAQTVDLMIEDKRL
jgi:hypothetical protein